MGAFDDLVPAAPAAAAPKGGAFDDLIPAAAAPKPERSHWGGDATFQIAKGMPLVGGLVEKGAAKANAAMDPAVDAVRGWMGKEPIRPHGTYSERYQEHLGEGRQADKAFEEAHPIGSTALQVGGGLAAMGGGSRLGMTPAQIQGPPGVWTNITRSLTNGPAPSVGGRTANALLGNVEGGLGRRALASGASGAGLGMGESYIRDEDPTSGGLAGGAIGAAGPIVGRVAGAIQNRARGVSAPRPGQLAPGGPSVADRSVPPTADELKAVTNVDMDAARSSGVEFHPNVVSSLAHTNRMDLENRGFPQEIAPFTHGVVNRLAAADPQRGFSANNMIVARTTLGNIRQDAAASGRKQEALAAGRVIDSIDNMLMNADHTSVRQGDPAYLRGVYPNAVDNSAAQHRLERVENREYSALVDAGAANSGNNYNNRTRQQLKPILKKEALQGGHSPEEIDQLDRVVLGTRTGNMARAWSHVAGGGGGLGRATAAGWGGTAGHIFGGPAGAAAGAVGVPVSGYIARKIGDASTARQTRIFNDMVALNSPAGAGARAARAEGAANNANAMQRGAIGSRAAQTSIANMLQQLFAPQ